MTSCVKIPKKEKTEDYQSHLMELFSNKGHVRIMFLLIKIKQYIELDYFGKSVSDFFYTLSR